MSFTKRDLREVLADPQRRQRFLDALEEEGLSVLTLVRHDTFEPAENQDRLYNSKSAVILDVETTGVDTAQDDVIELAALKIHYDSEGIISLGQGLTRLREPDRPIPPEVIKITGITDEMVAGKTLTGGELAAFIDGSDLIIAHNAAFDRQMTERVFPEAELDEIRWACSLKDIDWDRRGQKARSLEMLCLKEGLVYGAHRAEADVLAVAFVLNGTFGVDDTLPAQELFRTAGLDTLHIVAKDAPFESKDLLKANGYAWSPDGVAVLGHKAWHKEIIGDDPSIKAEKLLLKDVYKRSVQIPAAKKTALERYSVRQGQITTFDV